MALRVGHRLVGGLPAGQRTITHRPTALSLVASCTGSTPARPSRAPDTPPDARGLSSVAPIMSFWSISSTGLQTHTTISTTACSARAIHPHQDDDKSDTQCANASGGDH